MARTLDISNGSNQYKKVLIYIHLELVGLTRSQRINLS